MSCHMVPKETIDIICAYAIDHKLTKTPSKLGAMLWRENAKSVNDRYPHHAPTKAPRYRFDLAASYTLQQVKDNLAYWDYNACEASNYEASDAAKAWRDIVRHFVDAQRASPEAAHEAASHALASL